MSVLLSIIAPACYFCFDCTWGELILCYDFTIKPGTNLSLSQISFSTICAFDRLVTDFTLIALALPTSEAPWVTLRYDYSMLIIIRYKNVYINPLYWLTIPAVIHIQPFEISYSRYLMRGTGHLPKGPIVSCGLSYIQRRAIYLAGLTLPLAFTSPYLKYYTERDISTHTHPL